MENAVTFMSITEFKHQIGAQEIQILRNNATDKIFASDGQGNAYKVQQSLELNGRYSVLIPNGNLGDACIINAGGVELLAAL